MEIRKFENLTDLTDLTETRDQLQVFSRNQNKMWKFAKTFRFAWKNKECQWIIVWINVKLNADVNLKFKAIKF